MIKRSSCLLCTRDLEDCGSGIQKHPQVEDCLVTFTDALGVAIDDVVLEELANLADPAYQLDDDDDISFQLFQPVDQAIKETFESSGLERLGGMSSGRGWSSISLFQRCPYAWKRRYLVPLEAGINIEQEGLAVGTLIHAFLALYYSGMMDERFAVLTPEIMYERLRLKANPEFVFNAWRVFQAYVLYYSNEVITPLAIEYDLRDPRTNESCRYDLIAYFPVEQGQRRSGTFIVEHKSAGRFDYPTLHGWPNDGEVLGQVALWKRCGLDKRFGELRGVIVNILGKQKEPQFHRTIVAPTAWQTDAHLDELKRWEGLIQLSRSTDNFPRARAGCITRYGLCSEFEHCASND